VLTWPRYYKHAGLAASTVVAAVANSLALGWMLHRRLGSPGWAQIARTAGVTTLCAAVMGAASVGVHRVLAAHVSGLAALGGAIAAGVAVYTALVCLACGRERRELLEAFRERRGVSGPDDEWDEL
jgi:peptidoglycan biosynthesis protein MviN/MurJ (putative lipid II flippase)